MAAEIENLVSERGEAVKNGRRLSDGSDCVVFDDDATVGEDSAIGIHGDDGCIVEYHHRVLRRRRRRCRRRCFHFCFGLPRMVIYLGWCDGGVTLMRVTE